jgi:hypothetical protein
MNKKITLLIISIILAIIVFTISTSIQKKLVNYVPTMPCYISTSLLPEYTQITKDNFKLVNLPVDAIANSKVVTSFDDISGLYLKSDIYPGQILLHNQLSKKEDLMIFSGEEGKEKISIKIKNSESGVSYILKKGSSINLYATIINEYAVNGVFSNIEKVQIGTNDLGYSTIRILENVKVLGTFDEDGIEVENSAERVIDTILVCVTHEEAQKINLLKDIATFGITEL